MKKLLLVFSVCSIFVCVASCNGSSSTETFKVLGAPTLAAVSEATVSSHLSPGTHYGSPTFEQIKIYTFWVGLTADCKNLVQLADYGADGQKFDMFDNPTLFEGTPTAGTYNCVVIKLSDTMHFIPAEDSTDPGHTCVKGTTYSYDIARGGDEDVLVDNNFDPIVVDGTENIMYFFASTDTAEAIASGVGPNQITNLTSPLVSPGQVTMVLDFTDLVYIQKIPYDTGTDYCWLDQPNMAFK